MKITKKVRETYTIEMSRESAVGLLSSICAYIDQIPERLDGWSGVDELEGFACQLRLLTKQDDEVDQIYDNLKYSSKRKTD